MPRAPQKHSASVRPHVTGIFAGRCKPLTEGLGLAQTQGQRACSAGPCYGSQQVRLHIARLIYLHLHEIIMVGNVCMAAGTAMLLLVSGGDDSSIQITLLRMKPSESGFACDLTATQSLPSVHTSAIKVNLPCSVYTAL